MKKTIYLLLLTSFISFGTFAQNKKGDIAISAGIGAPSHLELIGFTLNIGHIIGGAATGDNHDLTTSKIGALTFSGKYSATDRLRVGGDIIFESFEGKSLGDYSALSIIPRVDYIWVNKASFRFYSGIGIGASFVNRTDNTDYSNTELAYNIAPLGIEVGNKIAFYAEGGFGYSGMISGGIRFKL